MGRATLADAAAHPSDLTAIPAGTLASSPESSRHNTKRKQTLLTLLDALAELSKDEELGGTVIEQPSFEDDRDVPTVDEHLQKVGAEAFNKFQRRIHNLDRELRNFANAARQLGSSVGILSSSFHLRERLAQILFLFRENAADLFPRKVPRRPRESLVDPNLQHWRKSKRYKPPPHVANPTIMESLDPEDFPFQLQMFAKDVTTFLDCLNEFPEFTDEAVNSSILSLEGDLKYWASCLKAYEGQFRYPAVERYLHDLSAEMGEHLDSITSSLSVFIEIGVPTIRFAQKHTSQNLLNLSTVATFFSAVTATTMQFSYTDTHRPIADAVNGFWFTSLVFSIGAAVNSLLGLTWKQAMYRSPGHRVPWWVLIWIKRSPLVFLVLSVACFSIGLVLFAYSSNQHRIVATITTIFSAMSCFGLAAVSAWFASERWAFTRHKGRKWLADVISETKVELAMVPGVKWIIYEPRVWFWTISGWCRRHLHGIGRGLSRFNSVVVDKFSRHNTMDTDREKAPEDHNGRGLSPVYERDPSEPLSPIRQRGSDASPLLPISEMRIPTTVATSTDALSTSTIMSEDGSSNGAVPTAKSRFASAVRSVMMLRNAAGAASMPFTPRRQRTTSSDGQHSKGSDPLEQVGMLRTSRVATLVPKLKSLEPTQDLPAHQALVRHLQFSPNGRFLATSSWDRTSVIFRVGDPFTVHRILAHPQGFVGQVAWSPTGHLLLTKLNRGIKVWTEDGVCRKTIDRRRSVQSIAWLPGGEGLMSVEGSDVVRLDLSGQVLDTYHFDRMTLHDVAVTQDGQRMLCVGTLMASGDGLHPSKSRAEKQIIAYNLDKKEIDNRVPVLHDVRDITLAKNDQVALVSYENKAPPQLWKIEMVKDTARLSLRHTYMPKFSVDFAGPSYFGGKNDQLVLCAGKAGDIHIWDRESAALLHHVRAQALGGDLTCIAWNHPVDPFMFATGSHDGAVKIWTTPSAEQSSQHYSQEDSAASSQAGTNGRNTPRTISPSPYELGVRAESPSMQSVFGSRDALEQVASPLQEQPSPLQEGPSTASGSTSQLYSQKAPAEKSVTFSESPS
ncbi:WD40 repeat-like protein [Obba rivulosa]|uniref:WD40 repeat-like protein n=1 Tax=Obba rivulosa TaxID=1052685 RepID=A0A8E2ARK9_9APHY|nr:WD40 repeat-like protein [Obba rivulosa]